jgi:hypothetical protein
VDVLTYHNDLARDGANTSETQLTTANVNTSTFGKKLQLNVDGQIYAQPLVVSGLAISRGKLPTIHRNMVYVATENDTVYAYDSDRGQLVWAVRTLGTSFGETPIPATDTGSDDLTPQIGITSTPVIDRSNNTMYVLAQAKRGSSTYVTRLYALDLSTGAKLDGGPVFVTAAVAGTGSGQDSNGNINFQSLIENQRTALTLVNGSVYMGFASHGDLGPYHGWVLGYDENTLRQTAVWNVTPNGVEGGIWQSGGGFAVDADGNLFIATGNGDFNADMGGPNFSDSLVKISTTSGPFTPSDSFTPFNQADLQGGDLDFGSTGVLLLPDSATPVPEALVGGKEGKIYVVDQDNLGGFGNGVDNIIQTIQPANGQGGGFDTFSYFNGNVYYASSHGAVQSFAIQNDGTLSPNQDNGENISFPGANPSISANGTSNGIVWYIDHSNGQAVLRAYAANDLSHQIYASNLSGKRDRASTYVKFSTPTIANGKVFVGTADQLDIYGLL